MRTRCANGWTGGQYSALRFALGAYLLARLACLLPSALEIAWHRSGSSAALEGAPHPIAPDPLLVSSSPTAVVALLLAACGSSALFALGVRDRIASVLLLVILILLHLVAAPQTTSSPISTAAAPFIGWILLAHAFTPRRPYGSWDARGRIDPGADWRLPGWIHTASWIALATAVAYGGASKLGHPAWIDGSALERALSEAQAGQNPVVQLARLIPPPLLALASWGVLALEIGFAPLAICHKARPCAWLALLGAQLLSMCVGDFAGLNSATLMLQLLTFDPAWVRGSEGAPPATIFYDGGCGLCHRFVRFALAEDREGEKFRFAPLEGEVFAAIRVDAARAGALGEVDSIVLALSDGRLLVRASAMLEIGRRLGGLWRVVALAARPLPRRWLDAAYDGVATIRHRLVAAPPDICPTLPERLRARFDLS